MGYHAGKPIESVIYCLNKLELKDIVSWEATCIKELGCCIIITCPFLDPKFKTLCRLFFQNNNFFFQTQGYQIGDQYRP